ncbi:MAG: helix-turn-helix domain-containing protein, partial [Aeromicrobium sp.]
MGTSQAAEVAPEIDRLVLAVNNSVDNARLSEAAGDRVVDWMVLNQFGDFLAAGVLTPQIAPSRSPYRPREVVRARLHELVEQGLVEHRGQALAAAGELLPLIGAFMDARADAAATLWRDHDDDVDQASQTAQELGALASDDHIVAVAHRAIPEPEDPYLRLHSRLVTLRYVRQHDHVAAWQSHGLTSPEIIVMTSLWNDEDVAPGEGLDQLVAKGLASDDPSALTDAGRRMREE